MSSRSAVTPELADAMFAALALEGRASSATLATRLGISVPIARRALAALRKEGLVETRPGSGLWSVSDAAEGR